MLNEELDVKDLLLEKRTRRAAAPKAMKTSSKTDRLLEAGDAAIRRALSEDSEAFLQANRQLSGE